MSQPLNNPNMSVVPSPVSLPIVDPNANIVPTTKGASNIKDPNMNTVP